MLTKRARRLTATRCCNWSVPSIGVASTSINTTVFLFACGGGREHSVTVFQIDGGSSACVQLKEKYCVTCEPKTLFTNSCELESVLLLGLGCQYCLRQLLS